MNNRLILVRGVPGSGKSTFAKKSFPGCLILENDMFHTRNGEYCFNPKRQENAIQWCIDTASFALSRGMDVVVANTFTKIRYIEFYRKLAEMYGAEFKVYRMCGNFGNLHGLSEYMVENFRKSMEDYPFEIEINP